MSPVDVIVVSYNSRETLRACVEPLTRCDDVTVTVVDNDSSDGSVASVADLPLTTIATGRNGGFAYGCNRGWAAGSAPFVLFINPDARIDDLALARLAAVLEAEPAVGVVGPRLTDADGALVRSMRRYQRLGSTWATALFLHRVFRRAAWANEIIGDPTAYDHAAYPEWISGACMLARRSVLEEISGFSEDFFLYGEDMDLCARIREAGWLVRYEPGAEVFHEGGRSAPRPSLYPVLARSRIAFARRHHTGLSALGQRIGLCAGALTHVAVTCLRPTRRRGHVAALRATIDFDHR
jgi:N-acetylglucosaminyl-diphospho-decaprenol L-rhamnosyltransferase